jgi:hypothetical protein
MIRYHPVRHTYTQRNQLLQGLTRWLRYQLWPHFKYAPLINRAQQARNRQTRRGLQALRVMDMKKKQRWRNKQGQTRWWRRSNGTYYSRPGSPTFDLGTWIDEQVTKVVSRYSHRWPPPAALLLQLHPLTQRVFHRLSSLGLPIASQMVVGSSRLRVATRIDIVVRSATGKIWLVELKTYCAFTYHQATTNIQHIGGPCSPERQHQLQALMNEYLYQVTTSPSRLGPWDPARCEGVLLLIDSSSGKLSLVRLDPSLRQRLRQCLAGDTLQAKSAVAEHSQPVDALGNVGI